MSQTKLIRRLVDSARENRTQAVVALLDYGLDPNQGDHHGNTALIVAAHEGHVPLLHLLTSRGAAIDHPNRDGATPLMWAAQANRLSAVRALISLGANIHATDNDGVTPLMYAANTLANGCARVLLRRGAIVNARAHDGNTALIYAVYSGCANYLPPSKNPTVVALLEAGADPYQQDADGASAFSIAQEHKASEYLIVLEKHRPSRPGDNGGV